MSAEDDLLEPGVDVSLGNCDREPIHIPGSIQPHGLLLALSEPELTVVQVSDNVESFVGRGVERVLGAPAGSVLGEPAAEAIREIAGRLTVEPLSGGVVSLTGTAGAADLELTVHRSGRVIVCELEPRSTESPDGVSTAFADGPPSVTEGAEQLFARTAAEIRGLTGYDRVMVYRFDPDGHGEVVGEAHSDALEPLLGHHYPATDIPRQARALYLRQTIRMIVDTDYMPATIVPTDDPATGQPLDLGLASLRAVSPIHLQYLRNMGVAATLTISLIRDGALWGMIACHHGSPLFVTRRVRHTCRFIGQLLSAQLNSIETFDHEREREVMRASLTGILRSVRGAPSTTAGLRSVSGELAELLVADGVAVVTDAERITFGYVPEPGIESQILTRVRSRRPLVIDRLSREMPSVSHDTELSGVLAFRLGQAAGSHIVWYRDDWARELKWGGDPNASLRPDLTSMDVKTLSPRRSFETWRQAVVGQSRPWSRAQVEIAADLVEALAD